jgi:phosphate transport system substrate-binding protein
VNDEFLYRLRQPPPPAFAARLRARLESQALRRRFRGRQITLYTLIACSLGGTALALVSPSVRSVTSSVLREVLPEQVLEIVDSRSASLSAEATDRLESTPPAAKSIQASSKPQARSGSGVNRVAADAVSTSSAPAAADARTSYIANGRFAAAPTSGGQRASEIPEIKLAGAKAVVGALMGAITEFDNAPRRGRIVIEASGTSQGVAKFCAGQADIALATRLMTSSEQLDCKNARPGHLVLPVAYEALAVFANPANDWVDALSTANLTVLFDASQQLAPLLWSQIDSRGPTASIEPLLPRAGASFAAALNEIIFNGKPQAGPAVTTSEEQHRLFARLQRSINSLTVLPFASYPDESSRGQPPLKALKIVNAEGIAVSPAAQSIRDGSYPLARLLFIYIDRRFDRSGATQAFVEHILITAERMLARTEYLPLLPAEYQLARRLLWRRPFALLDGESMQALTAREVLLRQVPEAYREKERSAFGQ